MAGPVLYSWGGILFQVWPLNFHELDHMTRTDYAKKEVLEALPQREWVGEGDEEIQIRGRVFPFGRPGSRKMEGWDSLTAFEGARREGQAQMLIRGGTNGTVLGWFVVERLVRQHRHLAPNGIGKMVEFEALFTRCDSPDPVNYFGNSISLWT